MTDSGVSIDYSKTLITTSNGEQLRALLPKDAAETLTVGSAYATGLILAFQLGASHDTISTLALQRGIGILTLAPLMSTKGLFFFTTPSNQNEKITFKFLGIPGNPEIIVQ